MADFVANLLPNAALSAVGLQPGFQTAGIGEVSSGSLFPQVEWGFSTPGIFRPTPIVMAKSSRARKKTPYRPAARRRPPDPVLDPKPEKPQKPESALKRFVRRFVWDPVRYDEDTFDYLKRETRGGIDQKKLMGNSTAAFAGHGKDRKQTKWFVDAVRKVMRPEWKVGYKARVLEIGSGNGALAREISNQLGIVVHELDMMPREAATDMTQGDMKDMPFRNGGFPVVVSSFAVEYGGAPALREVYRVLPTRGKFIALVHHKHSSIAGNAIRLFKSPIGKAMKLAYEILYGVRLTRLIFALPLIPYGSFIRLGEEFKRVAYEDRADAIRQFEQAGFRRKKIKITDACAPRILWGKGKPDVNFGYFIVAEK